jgi:mono/diheme cytochrome c family protein/glucose/arabinose dehydrogenase
MTFSKMRYPIQLMLLLATLWSGCGREKNYADKIYQKPPIVKDPPIDFLSPKESMKTMHLPEGYHMELVASEPMINEPVTMAWGPNGKLYVAEMLTYMQDIDGTNQDEPWSRISVLEDLDGDGRMDKSTVFVDSLVLPRILLPLDDRVIVGGTYNRSLYSYRDTTGDNKADEKILILKNTVRDNANLEHQSASMMWSIDNWLYLSRSPFRYRFTRGKMEIDTLRDAPIGQWGLTEDESGQLFYSSAGGEVPALGYQQHPTYGVLEMEDKWEEGFEEVWPIIGTPDVQGGERRLRADGTLNHFTASCGQTIFLGDRLPAYGDLFIPEPVGRLIRRAKVQNLDGKIVLANAYDKTEFLASTDPNFRPVDTKIGPDGCLYIVDMYRGIIQEGNWVRKGSFLRPVVERKGFDKNFGKGRVYRVVHKGMKPSKQEKLLDKTSEELLSYLSHPNGWYRITAQKLLVLRQDPSITPRLKDVLDGDVPYFPSLFNDRDYALGRLHALWTLEGLDAVDENLIVHKLMDEDSRVRRAALRIGERYLKNGNGEALKTMANMQKDSNKDVLLQLMLSLRSSKDERAKDIIARIMVDNKQNQAVTVIGEESIKEVPLEIEILKEKYVLENRNLRNSVVNGYTNFQNICASCHGINGMGIENVAPPLVGSPRVKGDPNIAIKIIMNGLTGPIDGKKYAGVMAGMKGNDDQWIADVLTYIRKELNDSSAVNAKYVKEIRDEVKDREDYWTIEELMSSKGPEYFKNN